MTTTSAEKTQHQLSLIDFQDI